MILPRTDKPTTSPTTRPVTDEELDEYPGHCDGYERSTDAKSHPKKFDEQYPDVSE